MTGSPFNFMSDMHVCLVLFLECYVLFDLVLVSICVSCQLFLIRYLSYAMFGFVSVGSCLSIGVSRHLCLSPMQCFVHYVLFCLPDYLLFLFYLLFT